MPTVLVAPFPASVLSLSSSTACAACTPESAALVFCSAVRRPSPSFLACCAELTAVLSAPPAVPDNATLRPLCFCSKVSLRVRRS